MGFPKTKAAKNRFFPNSQWVFLTPQRFFPKWVFPKLQRLTEDTETSRRLEKNSRKPMKWREEPERSQKARAGFPQEKNGRGEKKDRGV